MAKIVKDTKKAKKESAAQAAEDLNVIFPDLTITINGQPVSVLEYPFMTWLEIKSGCGDLLEDLSEFLGQQDNINADEILEFFENHYRTTRANVLLSYIYQINNELGAKKNRKESELSPLSGLVPRTGIEPVLLRTGV